MLPAEIDPKIEYELDACLTQHLSQRRRIKSTFLIVVAVALQFAAMAWHRVARYFDELLNEAETLLSPNQHDMLLIEDSTFKRSRRYVWAIDALSNFNERITEVVDVWEEYKSLELNSTLQEADEPQEERDVIAVSLKKAETEIDALRRTQKRFKNHLDRTIILRDGVRSQNLDYTLDMLTLSIALQRECGYG